MSLLLALATGGSVTVAAICLNSDGSIIYKTAATSSDNKLYLNSGQIYARLTAIGGDKILTISSGNIVAT
jgi:hypothetical protein